MASPKCGACNRAVRDGQERIEEEARIFHSECYPAYRDRKEFTDYVCKLFGLKKPGPVIYSQRRTFMDKYGYTDRGMVLALRYAYEVQGNKIANAQERIGLIPYVYDEAQAYFSSLEKKQEEIAQKLAQATEEKEREVIVVREVPRRQRPTNYIDPNILLEEGEDD